MVSELSRKLLLNSLARAAEFTKWGSHTADAPTRREKRLIGRTALGRSTRFSNITWTDALPRTSCVALICSVKANQNEGRSTLLTIVGRRVAHSQARFRCGVFSLDLPVTASANPEANLGESAALNRRV